MSSAFAPTPWPGLDVHCPADVCGFIDDLPEGAAGELSFFAGGAQAGVVFVEAGRVCWAAARGLSRRLSDLLGARAKVDQPTMESLYRTCKAQRAPLGEYLVTRGIVSAADLRSALLLHTAESLGSLAGPGAHAEWLARRGGYSPRFTFSTPELLARTFAGHDPAAADCGETELAESFSGGDWGAAYVRSAARGAPDPVALYGPCPDRIGAILRLGRWASSTLDLTTVLHGPDAFVARMRGDGAVVAWRSGAGLVAGWTSAHGPARLLNRRARARRQDGPHGGL